MDKSKLATGMTVEMKNGSQFRVLKCIKPGSYIFQEIFFAGIGSESWMPGTDYSNNLIHVRDSDWNIVKVYSQQNNGNMLSCDIETKLIWKREPSRIIIINTIPFSEEVIKESLRYCGKL